ncbi:hypothetical protein [Oleiagrimonas sp.]|jgi:hypothetical protein|uniref:hypothetical protein n=1 Tax=Oleiagrimonas sp. TaxID=2010330 RepID=UPI0026159A4C|nr:hypothetical protein [Oleiagrimonas sp.]MDA3915267.1 hypothetical protein [Oleiagrimonas sp.]
MVGSLDLLRELKRRHVYRVAVAYAAVGWLLIELATQVLPFFDIPNWTVRLVVLLVVAGFPIALVLAWAFEVTPDGVRRTEPADSAEARAPEQHHRVGRRLNVATIAVLALAVILPAWRPWQSRVASKQTAPVAVSPGPAEAVPAAATPLSAGAAIPAKSIAVLPLTNESDDKDQQYIPDGLSEGLITALTQFAGLKVISRNSSFQFRDSHDDSATIGRKLGVAHLLDGEAQRLFLADAEAMLGDKAAALWTTQEALARMPIEKDAINGAVALAMAAQVYARLGRADLAVSTLERVRLGSGADMLTSASTLKLDPVWDKVRDDPRFQAEIRKFAEFDQP